MVQGLTIRQNIASTAGLHGLGAGTENLTSTNDLKGATALGHNLGIAPALMGGQGVGLAHQGPALKMLATFAQKLPNHLKSAAMGTIAQTLEQSAAGQLSDTLGAQTARIGTAHTPHLGNHQGLGSATQNLGLDVLSKMADELQHQLNNNPMTTVAQTMQQGLTSKELAKVNQAIVALGNQVGDQADAQPSTTGGLQGLELDALAKAADELQHQLNNNPMTTVAQTMQQGLTSKELAKINQAMVALGNQLSNQTDSGADELVPQNEATPLMQAATGTALSGASLAANMTAQGGTVAAAGDGVGMNGVGQLSAGEINATPETGGKAEGLTFAVPPDSASNGGADVTLSDLYQGGPDGSKTEVGNVTAYDKAGNQIASVNVNGTANGTANVHIPGKDIASLVFTAVDNGAGQNANNSDFKVQSVTMNPPAQTEATSDTDGTEQSTTQQMQALMESMQMNAMLRQQMGGSTNGTQNSTGLSAMLQQMQQQMGGGTDATQNSTGFSAILQEMQQQMMLQQLMQQMGGSTDATQTSATATPSADGSTDTQKLMRMMNSMMQMMEAMQVAQAMQSEQLQQQAS